MYEKRNRKLNFEPLMRAMFENEWAHEDCPSRGQCEGCDQSIGIVADEILTMPQCMANKKEIKKAIRAARQKRIAGPQIPWLDLEHEIDRVIFNDPHTIILWKDGTKTKVTCSPNDEYDEMQGLAYGILKRICGNTNAYHTLFDKYLPEM